MGTTYIIMNCKVCFRYRILIAFLFIFNVTVDGFINLGSSHYKLSLSSAISTSAKPSSKDDIRLCTSNDIAIIADLLSNEVYIRPENELPKVSIAQRKELARLEIEDLNKRYGPKYTGRKFPSAMLVFESDSEIVGSAGIDCQILCKSQDTEKRFTDIKTIPQALKSDEEIVVVLANLCVRSDMRRKGIARALLKKCYELVKEWGFSDLYLLVDEMNEKAKRLYVSEGFKPVYRDDQSTCIAFGPYNLRTAPCVNVCYKKMIGESNSWFNDIFSMFRNK